MQVEQCFWRDRRVLVTGATGVVGAWLVKALLDRGAAVTALVRDPDPQSEFYRSGDYQRCSIVSGQLEDFWTLERAINEREIQTVFHLAAQAIVGVAHRFPWQTFEANVRGTYNLMEACRLHTGLVEQVVIASSDKAYGSPEQLPYVETMPLAGQHPYEVSKSCTDLIAQSYAHTYGLPVAIARCGNIYGGGDLNWSRIIPGTIRSLLAGQRPIIRSDGKFVRDYVYVKDAAAAYLQLAEAVNRPEVLGQGFNFSPETALSVLEVVDAVRRLMDCSHLEPDIQNTAKGEIRSQYLDSTKARSLLSWQPQYSLDEGLAETIAWYRQFLQP
jgi:CDP-glucose 4,6-dehydratase